MHRHHAKRVFLVKTTKLYGPQVDCQELQKPPRVLEISHLRAGNHSESNEKGKTTSINKQVDDHNTTGIAQVSKIA